jgi:integrase
MKRRHAKSSSILGADIAQFLTYKRTLGRRYQVEENTLAMFDAYLVAHPVGAVSEISVAMIDQFLASRPRQRPRSYNHLRGTLARLFGWMVRQGRLERTPVQSGPRRGTYQRQPFIFDANGARQLLALARTLPDRGGTVERGATYHTVFALLYGLGLRVGEVCRLQIKDVDAERRLLVIRQTKFYKSRLVPFGPKLAALLMSQLERTRRCRGESAADTPLFSLRGGRAINPCTISQTFHHLLPHLSIEIAPGTSPPRLHDLRHSFAVGALTRWYRNGTDPQAHLLALSTFMGHVDVNSTALYLTTTPTLLHEANRRFEAFAAPIFSEDSPS